LAAFGDHAGTLVGVLIFMAVAMLSFALMHSFRVHGAVKRRAAGLAADDTERSAGAFRGSGTKIAQKLVEFTQQHYLAGDSKDMKALRQRLIQAGIYDSRAVAYFFLARMALGVVFSVAVIVLLPRDYGGSSFWMLVFGAGLAGYFAPNYYLTRRIARRQAEHQSGFPDFMDLLVVCADSGLSMEASLDRVGRELMDSYPSLSANIHMANLEIRAGRTMTDALDHLADRLGLEEARSFSTLIAQSEELGSSVTEALRVYSDDMRHKRLSRAEEKAYALPAKLSLPLMVFIFPVLFVVIMLPVVVRLKTGNWG
jgi:tight adherence protein C